MHMYFCTCQGFYWIVLINSNKSKPFIAVEIKQRSELYVLTFGPKKKKKNSYLQNKMNWEIVGLKLQRVCQVVLTIR